MEQDDLLHKFGRRISILREQQGLTIDELAARSGVGAGEIALIEKGEADFQVTVVYARPGGLG
ncbi:helix-turn-helix domain-containing protein [Puia sp. P3]|uniref:helix-turn-helix domain-containing protein n=1 Tax=Puia sp. P3 TaxID=3423952 RepID=UPI003D6745CF